MTDPDERLLSVAKAVSDGEKVDWSRAESEAQNPEERELVGLLREIGDVAEMHRTIRRTEAAAASRPPAPVWWGRLEIQEKIGEGASAEVFRARDPKLDRDVALKIFRHGKWMNPEQRRALLIEGQNLARLRHENVVAVYGADEHDGRVGIWMELVEGRTLGEIVKSQGPYSATEASQIGIELSRALAAVHRRNVVHADLKSQNVKREEGGRIVLMDFSSSQRADVVPGNPESDPAGTPLYMAPELWERNTPTVESDIYALGVLLYFLVTGDYPVQARSIEELRRAHERGQRRLLRDERPELPDNFVRAVEKALSRNPNDRFRSAGALEEALRTEQVPAREQGLPVEVRVLAKTARIALWLGAIALTFLVLGFVNGMALNVVLGRPAEYAPESAFDWLVWGARSSIGPVYHAVTSLVPWLLAARILSLFEAVRRPFRPLARWVDERVGHAGWMLPAAIGAIGVAALTWWYFDLIKAIYLVSAGRGDERTLSMLSPANEPYHLSYRRSFTILIVSLLVMELVVRSWLKAHRRPRSTGAALGLAVVVGCAAIVMNFPWRILFQADFPRVSYAGESCYEAGERQDRLFLFCPLSSPSQSRIVERGDPGLVFTGVIESVFTTPKK
jgi:serine/threonine-protein kinase